MPCCRWVKIDVRRDWAKAPRLFKRDFGDLVVVTPCLRFGICLRDVEEGQRATRFSASVSCVSVKVVPACPMGMHMNSTTPQLLRNACRDNKLKM